MANLFRPFRALRPVSAKAGAVAAPPYDVLNSEEARVRAEGKPHSFLHISKPEIDLPPGTDPYSAAVYGKGAENLKRLEREGVLARDPAPYYYVYRLRMGDHVQTGIAGVASVAAYDVNKVRKHEFTTPVKEDDRVRQVDALNAQTGPVLVAYKSNPELAKILDRVTQSKPVYDVVGDGNVGHTLWVVEDGAQIDGITAAFDKMEALYIADGHHRSAAASRVAAARRAEAKTDSHEYFLAVAYPQDQMRILDYNRVVRDLNGLTPEQFLAKLRERFTVAPLAAATKPDRPGRFSMYLGGKWHSLDLKPELIPAKDPVGRLDVSLLQNNLLAAVLGISDPRRDKRIDFVGGIRGLAELEKRVNSGEMAVAFALHPTRLDQLMDVADAGQVMPPKSTWFEPKLADGLVSHVLD